MRVRSKVIEDYVVDASYTNFGLPIATSSQQITTKTITDLTTPSVHAIRRRGGVLPYLPCTIETLAYNSTPGSLNIRRHSDNKTSIGTIFRLPNVVLGWVDPPPPDPAIQTYVTNLAIANAKAEAFDMLTFIAEFSKSQQLIATRMGSVFDIAKSVAKKARTKHPKSLGKTLKEFNDLWLEARYGWRPMLYDIKNIMEQVNQKKRTYNEGRATVTENISSIEDKLYVGVQNNVSSSRVVNGTRTYRGFALAVGVFGDKPQINPVLTAWELVPYSFVLDWFMDIGSALAALTPTPGVDVQASGYSMQIHYHQVIEDLTVNKAGSGFTVNSASPGFRERTVDQYDRVRSGAALPRIHLNLNSLKLIDLAALVVSRSFGVTKALYHK